MKFIVVYGSVRSARKGILAARFVEKRLRARNHDVTLFDPLDLQLPLLDKMYKEFEDGEFVGVRVYESCTTGAKHSRSMLQKIRS